VHALAGQITRLAPTYPEPVAINDGELDSVQRDAVARALHTPDICLIQGLAGTGKSRVVTEIIAQLAARGQRVLFVAPAPAAIDRTLAALAARHDLCALRCLGPQEAIESLPPSVRRFTLAGQQQFLRTEAIERAREYVREHEQKLARLQKLESTWTRLEEFAERCKSFDDQLNLLAEHHAGLASEVERQVTVPASSSPHGSFGQVIKDHERLREEAVQRVEEEITRERDILKAAAHRLQDVELQCGRIRPVVAAWEARRFWTLAWWRALTSPGLGRKWSELRVCQEKLQSEVNELEAKIASLQSERDEAHDSYLAERNGMIAAEIGRRQAEVDVELNLVSQQRDSILASWQDALAKLRAEINIPVEPTPVAVTAAREQAIAMSRQWAGYLEQFAQQSISARLPAHVNVLAATTNGLALDRHFGDAARNGASGQGWFDYLVLEEAEQITQPDLLRIARRARRWILVGQAATPTSNKPSWEKPVEETPKRAPAPSSTPFQHLWELLHSNPRSLPYHWSCEQNRLRCRMRTLSQDQERWIETERVADFPDIELRILALPERQPCLAEILFPPSMSIAEAKQYIYNELQELAVETDAFAARWDDKLDRVVLALAGNNRNDELTVPLERGIREVIFPDSCRRNGDSVSEMVWHTSRIEFDRALGWDRPRAAQWLAQRLGLRDLGRTALLEVFHRMEPGLGEFLSSVLVPARPRSPAENKQQASQWALPPVEFVPVPDLPGRETPRGPVPKATSPGQTPALSSLSWPRRGGAGLELDLADPRQRERLPPEFRNNLPREGIVNFPEAQAVVRALSLLGQEVQACNGSVNEHEGPAIAVTAVYPAQAELIRLLVERVGRQAKAPLSIEIGAAASFRQREAAIVLLSLTRSHTHRAVAFGQDPELLALALTRARVKLILFGDAGTLLRRSQWDGPLEHLDQSAARRERHLISRLVHYLEGQGRIPHAFHSQQGGSS